MELMKLGLGENKRLKSQKKIERLFTSGKRFYQFPLTAVYFEEPSNEFTYQIAVSVPKKKFKKATDRNLFKRKIREAFRIHQHKLKNRNSLEIMFIYSTDKEVKYDKIDSAMLGLIDLLNSISTDNILEK